MQRHRNVTHVKSDLMEHQKTQNSSLCGGDLWRPSLISYCVVGHLGRQPLPEITKRLPWLYCQRMSGSSPFHYTDTGYWKLSIWAFNLDSELLDKFTQIKHGLLIVYFT